MSERCPKCLQEIPPQYWDWKNWRDHQSVCIDNLVAQRDERDATIASLRAQLQAARETLEFAERTPVRIGPSYSNGAVVSSLLVHIRKALAALDKEGGK